MPIIQGNNNNIINSKSKLTDEEYAKLKKLNLNYDVIARSIGVINLQEIELKKTKDSLYEEYSKLREEETKFSAELKSKYGSNTVINIDGTFEKK